MALLACLAACHGETPNCFGMDIEMDANQPTPGNLVMIHARGGRSVFIAVEGGTFLAQTKPGQVPTPQPSACMSNPSVNRGAPFSVALSVRPTTPGALLFASLYVGHDCSGELVQSHIVVVSPHPALPADAGPSDGPSPPPGTSDAGVALAPDTRP